MTEQNNLFARQAAAAMQATPSSGEGGGKGPFGEHILPSGVLSSTLLSGINQANPVVFGDMIPSDGDFFFVKLGGRLHGGLSYQSEIGNAFHGEVQHVKLGDMNVGFGFPFKRNAGGRGH